MRPERPLPPVWAQRLGLAAGMLMLLPVAAVRAILRLLRRR